MREVLERELANLEWEQRIVDRAAELRSGRVVAVPLEDIEVELGFADTAVDSHIVDEIE